MWIFFDHTTHAAFPGKFAMAAITTDHTSVLCLPMTAIVTEPTSILPVSMWAGLAYAAVIWASDPAMWAWDTWA